MTYPRDFFLAVSFIKIIIVHYTIFSHLCPRCIKQSGYKTDFMNLSPHLLINNYFLLFIIKCCEIIRRGRKKAEPATHQTTNCGR